MSRRLEKLSRLLPLLLMLSTLTLSGVGGGGIPSAFGQNAFVNITGSDIIDLVDNITERVEEEVDDDIGFPLLSEDGNNNSNNNDASENNSIGNGASFSSSSPITTIQNIMINEIELNPTGEDDEGEEWIELYNPSDADINISNFEIRTSSGSATIKLPPDAIIEAGETYVIELEEEEQHLSNIIESLILIAYTPTGDDIVVDRTPSLVDMSNDDRTWQRIPDGDKEWRFVEETQGDLNDPDTPSSETSYDIGYSESDSECLVSAGCIEGITIRIVNGDTLYVIANNNSNSNTIYKVDLALVEAPSGIEEGLMDSTAFTQELCLGSNTLIDQDDRLLTSLVEDSSITAVVYCSSSNLNKELLDNGYAELDVQQCATSEFASESWAKDHGC